MKSKRYFTLKAEYRALSYKMEYAYNQTDRQFNEAKAALRPRMMELSQEIDAELNKCDAGGKSGDVYLYTACNLAGSVLIMFAFASLAVWLGKSCVATDSISETNRVIWAEQSIFEWQCPDGKTYNIALGFRDDGVVVWRIDDFKEDK